MVFLVYEIVHIERYETTSVEDIGIYKGTFYEDMALFPKESPKTDKVVAYEYKYAGGLLDDAQYVLLTYQYDSEADYDKELERLRTVKVAYTESKFDIPAYIYKYREGDNSEFALLDDAKKQITYVYVQCPFDFEGEAYADIINSENEIL